MFVLKQRIQKMKALLKVQLQQNKKQDKMFWLLLEQNSDVKNQIQNYKEVYEKSQKVNTEKVAQPQSVSSSFSLNVRSSSNTGISSGNTMHGSFALNAQSSR